uniref:Uncharacterized protein n=1 Tax=Euplotes harpa TaxID=151035 RepID=A0A7S3JHA8_9SPIT
MSSRVTSIFDSSYLSILLSSRARLVSLVMWLRMFSIGLMSSWSLATLFLEPFTRFLIDVMIARMLSPRMPRLTSQPSTKMNETMVIDRDVPHIEGLLTVIRNIV